MTSTHHRHSGPLSRGHVSVMFGGLSVRLTGLYSGVGVGLTAVDVSTLPRKHASASGLGLRILPRLSSTRRVAGIVTQAANTQTKVQPGEE
jgi:hypothetical protein